jgi:glycerol kinase
MLAALGGGLVGSLGEAAQLWQLQRSFEPEINAELRQRLLMGWSDAVARTLGHPIA